jgi:hypothetical protein
MPKKANVSVEHVQAAATRADDLTYDLRDLADEIRAGRCDEMDKAVDLARKFAVLARVAADVAAVILTRKAMADERDELESSIRAQIAAEHG